MRWDAWDIVTDLDLNVDPPTEGEELDRHERFVLRDDDPLDIHQATLNYLKKNGRQSINDVESLCRVILSSCLSAFDYNETPGEYHFFDFFESAIGHVVSQISVKFPFGRPSLLTKLPCLTLLQYRWIRPQSGFNISEAFLEQLHRGTSCFRPSRLDLSRKHGFLGRSKISETSWASYEEF